MLSIFKFEVIPPWGSCKQIAGVHNLISKLGRGVSHQIPTSLQWGFGSRFLIWKKICARHFVGYSFTSSNILRTQLFNCGSLEEDWIFFFKGNVSYGHQLAHPNS